MGHPCGKGEGERVEGEGGGSEEQVANGGREVEILQNVDNVP